MATITEAREQVQTPTPDVPRQNNIGNFIRRLFRRNPQPEPFAGWPNMGSDYAPSRNNPSMGEDAAFQALGYTPEQIAAYKAGQKIIDGNKAA